MVIRLANFLGDNASLVVVHPRLMENEAAQLGLHQKPFALLNIKGYYDSLLKFFDLLAVTEEFLRPIHRSLVLEASEPENLLNLLANYQPQNVDKWIRKDVKP